MPCRPILPAAADNNREGKTGWTRSAWLRENSNSYVPLHYRNASDRTGTLGRFNIQKARQYIGKPRPNIIGHTRARRKPRHCRKQVAISSINGQFSALKLRSMSNASVSNAQSYSKVTISSTGISAYRLDTGNWRLSLRHRTAPQ